MSKTRTNIYTILLFLSIILLIIVARWSRLYAEDDVKVYDSQNKQIATVKESSNGDQKIYDTKWQQVGTIRDGKVYDST